MPTKMDLRYKRESLPYVPERPYEHLRTAALIVDKEGE